MQIVTRCETTCLAVNGENNSLTMFSLRSWDFMLSKARSHRRVRPICQDVNSSSSIGIQTLNEPCLQEYKQIWVSTAR